MNQTFDMFAGGILRYEKGGWVNGFATMLGFRLHSWSRPCFGACWEEWKWLGFQAVGCLRVKSTSALFDYWTHWLRPPGTCYIEMDYLRSTFLHRTEPRSEYGFVWALEIRSTPIQFPPSLFFISEQRTCIQPYVKSAEVVVFLWKWNPRKKDIRIKNIYD